MGHALELLSEYQIPHGKAVAIGCLAESILSHLLGFLNQNQLDRIVDRYQFVSMPPFDPNRIIDAMVLDKKGEDQKIYIPLLENIGRVVPFENKYCKMIARHHLLEMLDQLLHAKR